MYNIFNFNIKGIKIEYNIPIFLIICYFNWNNKKSLMQHTFDSVKTNLKIFIFKN